ncbi:MAG: cadmium-translocating P-type ATPase [Alphaproteobacteria bacterium]|nr:cadmium-translocating P-type ATPase [Alphaproteobacteria bacterium]
MGNTALSENLVDRHAIGITPANDDDSGYESLVKTSPQQEHHLDVLIHGAHCAACIQSIEGAVMRQPGVLQARLNFSARRLSITWQGPTDLARNFVRSLREAGYGIQPYTPSTERAALAKEERFLLLCLGVAGFAMGNIMLLSFALWTTSQETMGLATRDFFHWISALIALPTILFSGRPFFRSAVQALSYGRTNMDVPISVGVVLACGMSLFETLNHGEHAYFDSAVMLLFFLLVGRTLDFRARQNARSAATDLLSTLTGFATIIDNGHIRRVAIQSITPGTRIRVAAGEKFPVDGRISDGHTDIDTSLITGESLPRAHKPGDLVYAGTINMGAPVQVTALQTAENTLLADIVRLMEKAGQSQALYVRLADRAAQLYTPVVHTLAALAFVFWWSVMGMAWQPALMIASTVLIITCPCALALAVPVAQVLAIGEMMKKGLLVKTGDALERLAQIDTVLMDKTGTLTLGKPQMITPSESIEPKLLQLGASLASHSTHPLSRALCEFYQGPLLPLEDVCESSGQGLSANYDGKLLQLGSRAWCGDSNAPAHSALEIWIRFSDQTPCALHFEDMLRPDAASTIAALKKKKLRVVLLTGDRRSTAEAMAACAGLQEVHADMTPAQKYHFLENLRAQGRKILMVGDGLNDAPVLAAADVSIAPGTALDVAQNAADIVFMGTHLQSVDQAHTTACITQKLVKENFALSIIYNILAIPLAIAGYVTPLLAALAMSGSSLLVIANSFRIRWIR